MTPPDNHQPMNVSPFVLLTRSETDAAIAACQTVLADWSRDWGVTLPVQIRAMTASDCPPSARPAQAQPWQVNSQERAWVWGETGWIAPLEAALFHLSALEPEAETHLKSPLAGEIASTALNALLGQWLHALTGYTATAGTRGDLPLSVFRMGSGVLVLQLTLGSARLMLALLHEPVDRPPRRLRQSPPLTPLPIAVAQRQVKLTVELGRARLTLRHLQSLAVGDVLTLPMHLDQALRVVAPGDHTLCHAHLGQMDQQQAIELIKAPSSLQSQPLQPIA